MVKELLLGDNPFIGVSHLSQEKAREEQQEAMLENKAEVIRVAFENGATGFTFSTHSSNLELLRYLSERSPDLLKELNYYILVPYVAKYVREATATGTAQLVKRVFTGSLNIRRIKHLIPPSPVNMVKIFLEVELQDYFKVLPYQNIKAVILHEVLTELIVAFNLGKIVKELSRYFSSKGIGFGLETRNIMHTKRFLEDNKLTVEYVMTPLNPLGYQMTPSKKEAEESIIELSGKGTKIIAINILASGALAPEDALTYLTSFKEYVFAIALGTAKTNRAKESFKLFKSLVS